MNHGNQPKIFSLFYRESLYILFFLKNKIYNKPKLIGYILNKFIYYLSILFATILVAQERPEVKAIRTNLTIKVDGLLDEEIWENIEPITQFIQRLPQDGAQPTEKSEMRIIYDDNYLYFGFTFFDSDPEKVRATILNRGGWIHRDDKLEIALDTYLDRRNAYLFEMNPLGTQEIGRASCRERV